MPAAESPFPSTPESTAAAALLLLSATVEAADELASPSLSPLTCAKLNFDAQSLSTGRKFKSKIGAEKSSVSSGSGSCISSSPEEVVPAHKLRIVALVARGHDMKLKNCFVSECPDSNCFRLNTSMPGLSNSGISNFAVEFSQVVRKKRSKVYWTSIDRKELVLGYPEASKSADSTETSCLSTTSSAASSARSRYSTTGTAKRTESPSCAEKWRKKQSASSSSSSSVCGSTHMKHQADSILKLLSRGSFSEVRIRQLLGDSPDTSKALRMLLRREEIKRSGSGGRLDPYIYKV
ncbi:unnamed protein product [Linum tenue]|uniref:HTH three-helical bundle domain-containing protein n=1 Tax=Linum tenue TaxID=586396 RepID=A0AAV0GQW1_9ROSI|nr:unnamed protein product [Linum tenue]